MRAVHNVHEREIAAPADAVGALLAGVGREGDRLWPSPAWVPMKLDRPVEVGADGGHGPIRYWVSDYEPGRRVRFTFHPQVGIEGYHELTVEALGPDRCVVRHVLIGRLHGWMRLLMPVAVLALHNAVLEDLLDNAEAATTGRVAHPARWSRRVRLLRRLEFPRPRQVAIPSEARLVRDVFDRTDLADAWQIRRGPGMPDDPQTWADAVFADVPRWVAGLLRLRNALVGLIGIERGDRSAFATVARDDGELLLGSDAGHLDFRASVLVHDNKVTVSTVAHVHNRRGRIYMAVVRRIHPAVIRSMLHRAQRRLAERPGVREPLRT